MREVALATVAGDVFPLSRTRRRRAREFGRLGDLRIAARLLMSGSASERLLQLVGDGVRDYLLIAADGGASIRLHLSIDAVHPIEQPIADGKVVIDWVRATVNNGDNRVSMSRTELRLLAALLECPEVAIPRATLIGKVWPAARCNVGAMENALAVYVCTLRKRLAAIGLRTALQTVRGVGYRIRL